MRRLGIFFALTLAVCFIAAAPKAEAQDAQFTNLKILPKDIQKKQLMKIMKAQSKALGVKCKFCHVMKPKKDMASDANEHKEMARDMMRMTGELNKLMQGLPTFAEKNPKATCFTCHQGKKEPAEMK